MLGKIEGKGKGEWQKMKWLDSITSSTDTYLSKLWEIVTDRGAWRAAVHETVRVRHDFTPEQQQGFPK